MSIITTRTVDLLARMALRAQAVSQAIYEADHRQVAHVVNDAATQLAAAAQALETALESYARAALADERPARGQDATAGNSN